MVETELEIVNGCLAITFFDGRPQDAIIHRPLTLLLR